MDNLLDLIKAFSKNSTPTENVIPKEIKDQYPYGEFPIRYTKSGQETLRKHSENRFSYSTPPKEKQEENNNFNLETILPLIQTLSTSKKGNGNMMELFSKLLFKDNPQMANLFKLFQQNNKKSVDVKSGEDFPNTNKVEISSLHRIK